MSVTFDIWRMVDGTPGPRKACSNDRCEGLCDECMKHIVNISNANARDLIEWLGLERFCHNMDASTLTGVAPAKELAALCERRLWDEARNHDPEITPEEEREELGAPIGGVGPRVVCFGRPAGYLRKRTESLLELAKKAGEDYVAWA